MRAQNIALGLIAAPCPQDLLAADVNESGSVSGADLVEMVNVLIGRSSAFSKSPSMTFMINGENRRCIDMDIQNLQQENLSIQAIKKGDLNCVN